MKRLLKVFSYIFVFLSVGLIYSKVYAASGSISVTSGTKQIIVGNKFTVKITLNSPSNDKLGSWEYSLDYDSNLLSFVSSDLEGSTYSKGVATTNSLSSKTYTVTFKTKKAGTAKIGVKNANICTYKTEECSKPSSGSVSVTIKTQAQVDSNKSSVNTLSSLSVSGQAISPKFDKNTLNYSVTVPNNVTNVTINATATDAKATVSGKGSKNLSEGSNKFSIVVTAENGSKKTYTINITRKELNPVKVTINGEEYTVIQKKNNLPNATNYNDTTVSIAGNQIPALSSDITKYTLVGLTDKDGNTNLYIKDGDNYTLYKEFKFSGITLALVKANQVINGSKEDSIKIGDETLNVYKLDGLKYPLIYGVNTATGESNWYTYESSENTIQKLDIDSSKAEIKVTDTKEEKKDDKKSTEVANKVNNKYETITYILSGVSGLLFIGLIITTIKASKNRKEHINY